VAALAQKHAAQTRGAFSDKADDVIERHRSGEHSQQAIIMANVLAGLETELTLPVQSVSGSRRPVDGS